MCVANRRTDRQSRLRSVCMDLVVMWHCYFELHIAWHTSTSEFCFCCSFNVLNIVYFGQSVVWLVGWCIVDVAVMSCSLSVTELC
jgi:hypothetical protein